MNPDLLQLHPYPFEKLAALKAGAAAHCDKSEIFLSIGEPKHAPPAFALEALYASFNKLGVYPATKGIIELRSAIAAWLETRFKLAPNSIDTEQHILPVNGTREALFAFVQAMVDRTASATANGEKPVVVCPNPFYQIYEGAAYLAGAEPYFVDATSDNNFIPDYTAIPAHIWQRCQVVFVCSPGNPTGAVMNRAQFTQLIELADRYDFIIASDECYSELYFDEAQPPLGLLQVCAELGRHDFARCMVFHSLSKRSNLPGLRSGFVAGDAALIKPFLLYRTYHGCAMSVPVQIASAEAWGDESHVRDNRAIYAEKFTRVLEILQDVLDVQKPDAGFYLWPRLPINGEIFAQQLYGEEHVTVLPGSFLSRACTSLASPSSLASASSADSAALGDESNGNPGAQFVRMALVAPLDECIEAAERIRAFVLRHQLHTTAQGKIAHD